MKLRKVFGTLLAAALCFTAFTGTASAEESSEEPVTLTFFHYKSEWADAFQEVFDALEADCNIRVVQESASSTVYFETLQAKLISGEMPDIFHMLVGKSNFDAWNTECADLSGEEWVSKVPSSIIEMCDYDGKLLAMPLAMEGYSIAYNKDLFAQAGIEELPTTITELREACEKLEAAGIQPFVNAYTDVAHVVRRMFTTPFAHRENAMEYFNDVLENGGDFTQDASFNAYYDFLDLTMEYGNEDALTMDFNTERSAFINGEAAMVAGEGMWMKSIAENAGIDINMGLMPILTSDNEEIENVLFNIPQSFCVYNGSEHVEEAKIALNYMLTSDAADKFFTVMGAYPAYSESSVDISAMGDMAMDFQSYLDEDKTFVMFGPSFPAAAQEDIFASVQKYLAGKCTREESLQEITDSWNRNINQ
ncbi:MAG: extracellular solute-binding protein [Lachnospiraceae bacterium]|nr:extracellular solute-binding protein [Lachnospiraceae bacterium]